jgi:GT2 family glycosyltransferase
VIGVTAVMVPFNNEAKAMTRLVRDLLPALRRFDYELVVIDNSAARCNRLATAVETRRGTYHWQQGRNLGYGPAMNLAVRIATRPYLLYVCSEHGRAYDNTWARDLLAPLLATNQVAMTGSIQAAGPPANLNFPDHLPEIHVQGGVFAARTEVLRRYPYPGGHYAHLGADLFMCFQLMAAGFELRDVPSVKSVWRTGAPPGTWKYVHDAS